MDKVCTDCDSVFQYEMVEEITDLDDCRFAFIS